MTSIFRNPAWVHHPKKSAAVTSMIRAGETDAVAAAVVIEMLLIIS